MPSSSAELVLSNAKAKDWAQCHYKYRLKRVDGWRPRAKALPLERGSWIHELLMVHYDGENWEDRHEALTKRFTSLFEEEREELGDLPAECERMMRAYLRHYRDENWKVIESEMDQVIELPNGLRFRFVIDLIIEEDGKLWLVDHKTVTKFMDADFMILDAQLARYAWCAEYLGFKPIHGVLYNEVRTKPPSIPALLKSGRLTQKKNQDTDLATYLMAIKELGQDPKTYMPTLRRIHSQEEGRFFRRTRLPKDSVLTQTLMDELVDVGREISRAERIHRQSGGRMGFPRSPSKSCLWCDYLTPCQIALMGADPTDELKRRFTRQRDKED